MSHEDPNPAAGSGGEEEPLLKVRDLKKHYPIEEGVLRRQVGTVRAVDGVHLDIYPGDIHAIVGESGCGKSTFLETVLGLEDPTEGTIEFQGKDLAELSKDERRTLKSEIQIVFQNPESSLDPRNTSARSFVSPSNCTPARRAGRWTPGSSSCWTRSDSPRTTTGAIHTNCPVGSNNGWRSPVRSA
jgi:ABC-type glutathione transport system ATPase component